MGGKQPITLEELLEEALALSANVLIRFVLWRVRDWLVVVNGGQRMSFFQRSQRFGGASKSYFEFSSWGIECLGCIKKEYERMDVFARELEQLLEPSLF